MEYIEIFLFQKKLSQNCFLFWHFPLCEIVIWLCHSAEVEILRDELTLKMQLKLLQCQGLPGIADLQTWGCSHFAKFPQKAQSFHAAVEFI